MKLQPYHKGAAVKLTDHRIDKDFYLDHYENFDDEWKDFWDKNVDRTFYVKDAKHHDNDWEGRLEIFLQGLPKELENTEFYSHELEGIVAELPDELFVL